MIGIQKIVSTIMLLCVSLASLAQSEYAVAYNNGKTLFSLEKYTLAMEAFKPAMEKSGANPYAPYASFYYAVSAYRSGFKPLARDMFIQVTEKFGGWEFENEAYLWTALIFFEDGDYYPGLRYASKLQDSGLENNILRIEKKYLSQIESMVVLENLYNNYPQDEALAMVIVEKMDTIPLREKNFELLQRISESNGITTRKGIVPKESIKKDVYKVAVVLPFIYENMEASGFYLRRSLVVDLYAGIRQGVEALKESDIHIALYAYDTKGDTTVTTQLLQNSELTGMDLIIGPLVPGPSKLVNDFSFKNKINIINPVSNNAEVIANNPFSFLLNPSSITIGLRGGEFAVKNLADSNKNMIVYYSYRDTDYQMAEAFEKVVQADSFRIISMKRVHRDSTEMIFNHLTMKIPVVDSLGNNVKDEEGHAMEELLIPPDSIGSIFVATHDYKIATEVFSAVADRGDSIQIIGHGNWLNDKTANYQYMQDLGIWMIAPDYVDFSIHPYQQFEKAYISKHHITPSEFVIAGYECMMFAGNVLDRFGVYFQNGLNEEVITGVGLREGYDFRFSNDNQRIPIIKFEDLDLVIQNDLTGNQ